MLLKQKPGFKHQKPLLFSGRIALELRITAHVDAASGLQVAIRRFKLREGHENLGVRGAVEKAVVESAHIGRVGLADFEVDVGLPKRLW